MTTKKQKPATAEIREEQRMLKREAAEKFVRDIDQRVTIKTSKTANRFLCIFENDALCNYVRQRLESSKQETGLKIIEAVRNKDQSFYVGFAKAKPVIKQTVEQKPESTHDFSHSDTVKQEDISEKQKTEEQYINEKLMAKLRRVGLGIKMNLAGEVEFYSLEHQKMFEQVAGVFQKGKEMSKETIRRIQNILGEFEDPSKLIDDFDFAIWILKSENVKFEYTMDIVTEGLKGESIEPRTAPIMFKKQEDATRWFHIFTSIGLCPAWQPGEPKHFWLIQRNGKKRKPTERRKRHVISNALEELGVKGHPTDTCYYYQNSVNKSYCVIMHATAQEDERVKFTEDLINKLQKKMPTWEFTLSKRGFGFDYIDTEAPLVDENAEVPTEKEEPVVDNLLSMFTPEMWRHILKNTPAEMIAEVFHQVEGKKYKKVLEKIQTEYVLLKRSNPMLPGIKEMKPDDIKEVSEFTS